MIEIELASIKHETNDIYTFSFKPQKPIRYQAGQFIELYLPHENKDDRGEKRWFSLSSSPSEEQLSITTRKVRTRSSFKQKLFDLDPRSKLKMADPMGDFVLPKDQSLPLIFVAIGIGITPFLSMIKFLTLSSERRNIKLIYAVKSYEDILSEKLFREYLGKNFETIIRNAAKNDTLTIDRVLQAVDHDNYRILLSGPEREVENLAAQLVKSGIKNSQIQTDYFHGYDT